MKREGNLICKVNNEMIFKKQLLYITTEPENEKTAPPFEFSRELEKYD